MLLTNVLSLDFGDKGFPSSLSGVMSAPGMKFRRRSRGHGGIGRGAGLKSGMSVVEFFETVQPPFHAPFAFGVSGSGARMLSIHAKGLLIATFLPGW